MIRRVPRGLVVLVALVLAGVVAARLGLIDGREAVAWAEGHVHRWWLAPAIAAAMAVLFAFALPGSTLFWVAGALYAPPLAATIVVVGGLAGSLAAYRVAGTAGGGWARERPERLVSFLRARSDFLTLVALRTLPTFPHAAINYSAGVLGVPLPRFLAASAVGFALKGSLYVTAIHQAARADSLEEALDWRVVGPLLGLALLLLVAGVARRRWGLARDGASENEDTAPEN